MPSTSSLAHVTCRAITLTLTASFALAGTQSPKEPAFVLEVSADRNSAIYAVGEKATFRVTLKKNGKPASTAGISFVVDDFLPRPSTRGLPHGKIKGDPSAPITATMTKPGFLRCRVAYIAPDKRRFQSAVGVGFAPTAIQPGLPVPEDFDEFWKEQKAALARIPLQPKLTGIKSPDESVECFDVQVPCAGGAPVSGYLSRPKDARPKSLPAILWVHGAGVRSSRLEDAVKGATAGMLSMDINAHGIPNGKPGKFYRELSRGELRGYPRTGQNDRTKSYFLGMYLRLVRAIDFLTAQPEWDGQTVIVTGHSQGGGQSLAAGGLDPRVTMIAPGVPAMCDHAGHEANRVDGWPKLVPRLADGKPDPAVQQAARYFDAVNFASRCRAEAIMSVGFIDAVCPPSSCYAAFNALAGKKEMVAVPDMGHAAPKSIQDRFFAAAKQHARRSR